MGCFGDSFDQTTAGAAGDVIRYHKLHSGDQQLQKLMEHAGWTASHEAPSAAKNKCEVGFNAIAAIHNSILIYSCTIFNGNQIHQIFRADEKYRQHDGY